MIFLAVLAAMAQAYGKGLTQGGAAMGNKSVPLQGGHDFDKDGQGIGQLMSVMQQRQQQPQQQPNVLNTPVTPQNWMNMAQMIKQQQQPQQPPTDMNTAYTPSVLGQGVQGLFHNQNPYGLWQNYFGGGGF